MTTGRPGTRTRIYVERGRSRGVVELSGNIPITRGAWGTWLVVEEPAVFAAGLLRQQLEARGVTITGGTRSVVNDAPARAQLMLRRSAAGDYPFRGALAVRRSMPLDELVSMINSRSRRSSGRVARNAGTFAAGARAVAEFLTKDVGIPQSAVQVTDGSGLSLLDETTPRALVQLLAHMRRSSESRAFYHSLPVVGEGLSGRMADTPAVGRLRGKTGTLSDVSALAGYVTTQDGEELAFAIIVNDAPSIRRARDVQDSIGVRLSLLNRGLTRASRPAEP